MTTVDMEAIRARSAHMTEAIDRLVEAPNPAHAAQAHAAAVASATDVPLLLNEIVRLLERLADVAGLRDHQIRRANALADDLGDARATIRRALIVGPA